MKKKVVFFGFSVTRYGNPPYPIRVKEMLSEEGCDDFDIHLAALGGVSLECVPYITEHLQKLNPNIVVFEIGTSHYSTEKKDTDHTKEILLQIINLVSAFCQEIEFLLLPRRDIPPTCTIPIALKQLSLQYQFGLIDLRNVFDTDWDSYANDNVHPSEKGIHKISEIIKDRLLNRDALLIEKQDFKKITNELKIKNFISHYQYPLLRFFEHSNFSFVAVPLRLGEILDFRVEVGCVLSGIFYIMGPDTSSLDLILDDQKITIRTFDKFSYYYRVGYHSFSKEISVKKNQLIKLRSSENRLNTILDKESLLKFDGITNYPISFSCKYE